MVDIYVNTVTSKYIIPLRFVSQLPIKATNARAPALDLTPLEASLKNEQAQEVDEFEAVDEFVICLLDEPGGPGELDGEVGTTIAVV